MEGFSEAEQCLLRRFLEQILVNIEKIQPEEAIEKLHPDEMTEGRNRNVIKLMKYLKRSAGYIVLIIALHFSSGIL